MMFLKSDEENANKEMDCHKFCIEQARVLFAENKFRDSSTYLKNAAFSLEQLQDYRDKKINDDNVKVLWNITKEKTDTESLVSILKSGGLR